jgi:predicted nucleic acid-binding protein
VKAYVDSSVVLRIVLDQPGQLADVERLDEPLTSSLTLVEVLRTMDRIRLGTRVGGEALAVHYRKARELVDQFSVVDLDGATLQRAAEPMRTPLGTLDALHLATALRWCEASGEALLFATHDRELAEAAAVAGLEVVGA